MTRKDYYIMSVSEIEIDNPDGKERDYVCPHYGTKLRIAVSPSTPKSSKRDILGGDLPFIIAGGIMIPLLIMWKKYLFLVFAIYSFLFGLSRVSQLFILAKKVSVRINNDSG